MHKEVHAATRAQLLRALLFEKMQDLSSISVSPHLTGKVTAFELRWWPACARLPPRSCGVGDDVHARVGTRTPSLNLNVPRATCSSWEHLPWSWVLGPRGEAQQAADLR